MVGHGWTQLAKPPGKLETFASANVEFCVEQVGVYAFGRFPGVEFGVFHSHGHDFGDRLADQGTLVIFGDKIFINGDGGGEFGAYLFRGGRLILALGHRFLQQISGLKSKATDRANSAALGSSRRVGDYLRKYFYAGGKLRQIGVHLGGN